MDLSSSHDHQVFFFSTEKNVNLYEIEHEAILAKDVHGSNTNPVSLIW